MIFATPLNFYENIQGRCTIPYQPIETSVSKNIPDVPQLLIEWLGICTKEEQGIFLKARNTILTYYEKMEEIIDKKIIQYGLSKSRLCAEICCESKIGKPILFLWLPLPSAGGVNLESEVPKFGRIRGKRRIRTK